jgi:hypothetical protein
MFQKGPWELTYIHRIVNPFVTTGSVEKEKSSGLPKVIGDVKYVESVETYQYCISLFYFYFIFFVKLGNQ